MSNKLIAALCADQCILSKIRNYEKYAQNMYAALCNNIFQQINIIEMLKGTTWDIGSCIGAAQLIKRLSDGKYREMYCSGFGMPSNELGDMHHEERLAHFDLGYVCEGTITPEITEDLFRIGWKKI